MKGSLKPKQINGLRLCGSSKQKQEADVFSDGGTTECTPPSICMETQRAHAATTH